MNMMSIKLNKLFIMGVNIMLPMIQLTKTL